MKNDDIKQAIGSIFDAITNATNDEAKESFGDRINAIAKMEDLKNMEKYSYLVEYEVNKVLRQVVAELNKEVTDRDKIYQLYFLYENYTYLDTNLATLIRRKEGSSCCVDKSRWLIKRYREYLLDKTIPDMTIEDKCYWKPHFGTGEQWMNLCEGLHYLYHGDPGKYLKSLHELIGSKE